MNIVNEANVDASWFCYNSDDAAQTFALASGDLSANGGKFSYDPPKNATGRYHVKFTVKGVPPGAPHLQDGGGTGRQGAPDAKRHVWRRRSGWGPSS